jgi:ribosomal protein S1
MSETSIRAFRREENGNLSRALIGNYIFTKREDNKLGFRILKFIDAEGNDDSIKIKDILDNDFVRIQNLFSVLDDLVAYDYSRFDVTGELYGFWDSFKEENFYLPEKNDAASKSPKGKIKNSLSQCEQAIKMIYCILGANEYIREKEEESEKTKKKYTFGTLLFDSQIDPLINSGRGRYNHTNYSVQTVIKVLLEERNRALHAKTAVDSESTKKQDADALSDDSETTKKQKIAAFLEDCRNKAAIALVALLHIVDYHYDALDAFFTDFFNIEENRKLLKEKSAKEKIVAFDPEILKKDYAQSILAASTDELKKNVGCIGNIANEESLKLMNLKMQLVWKDQAPVADSTDSDEDNNFSQEVKYWDLRHISDAENRVNVILGNPGSGKSTLLAQLQKTLVTRWIEGEIEAPFPISLALKSVGKGNFVDAILDSVGERLFSIVEPMCKAGEVVFILDGLNELPLKNPQNYLDSLCNTIRSEYSLCRFYITGRKHEFDEIASRFHLLKECSIYHMRDISRDDIIAYFRELQASEASKNTFLEWVQEAQLSDLLASPLNFSMIAKMVLNQGDFTVPVESINNRGELLDLFMKSTLQDKGILTEDVGGNFKLLQVLAIALDDNNNLPISRTSLSAYCKELYPDAESSVEMDQYLLLSLDEPCRLNVLSKIKDVNGDDLYSFTIDTYQEFFHARSFAVSFVGNVTQGISGKKLYECLSDDFNVRETRRFEMLKLALELIAGGRIQKETADQDGARFVEDFFSIYSGSLGILAELSSSLPVSAKARSFVEQEVLEQMVSYRESNVMPSPEEDKAELLSITRSAVKLSTDALYRELFNYYWMSATGMVAYWQFGFSFSFPPSSIVQFRTNLVSNCTNPIKFYDFLHQVALDIIPLYPASNAFLNSTRNLLFSELTTYRQRILYLHIRESYDKSLSSTLYSHPDHLLSQDASLLLMYMDDPEYIYHNLDLKEMKQTGTRIDTHTLMKLLQNFRHEKIRKIIFQTEFFNLLKVEGKTKEDREKQRKFKIATIIRYYLFRNFRPQELLDYLSPAKGNGLESLLEHERLPILDLLPISELRAFKQRYFDPDVFEYLDEYDDEEESVEGLHYRIYERNEDQTQVWIRNIATGLKGLTAIIGSNQAQIVDDELIISRQYRFKISSPAIINASGTILVSGQSIFYDAPFAGPEIVITTFDAQVAKLLSEAVTVQIGEAQICSVRKTFESLPKSWRVLTLLNKAGISYFGDMQFARNGEAVNIDKTIREEGFRYDPQLFRRLEPLPSQNCLNAPFVLLGLSNTKVWVVTDKLMNYDRYKNDGAIVRAKGDSVLCRFLEAHPITDGFVELTFRSPIPFEFPEEGTLNYSIDNQEEDSVPYAFCHSVGTRAVVRILDKEFLKSISVYKKRLSYMASYFRIGRLSLILDYVEIFPASERLSVWTLQRLSHQGFPHNGSLEVSKDTSFQKLYQLSFTKETRRTQTEFKVFRCLHFEREKGHALFVVDHSAEPIAPGLYLTHDECAAHLRILESNACKWIAETSFIPEMQIAQNGCLVLPGYEQLVHYAIVSQDGSRNTAVLYTLKDGLDFVSFDQIWNSGQALDFASSDGKVVTTGFRNKQGLSRMGEIQLLDTDVPAGFDPSFCTTDGWYLSVFCPIRNEMERGYDTVDNTIKVHSIPYTKFSEKAIIIRKPITEFGNLFVRYDNSPRFASIRAISSVKNEPYGINPFGIEYCTVELKGEGGKRLNINPNGEISFYDKRSDGFIPVSVGYRRVLEVIDLKKSRDLRRVKEITNSEKNNGYGYYPAQVCDKLIKELSDIDEINEDLVKFFADHSRAYMLFTENKLLSIVQSLECERPLVNLCTVSSIDKEGRINTFSWLNNDPFPSMDDVDSHVHVGDLVLVERNHKITPANVSLIKGSVFPCVGELAALDERSYDVEVSPNTWQQEENRVKKFKEDLAVVISFFSQNEPAKQFTVTLPDSGVTTDKNGIIVSCPELPDIAFRLCGVSDPSYAVLTSGGAISVLPSKVAQQSFNPYKFTPKGIISVIDATEQKPRRHANYYCVVNDVAIRRSRNENLVGVVYGDYLGAFTKAPGARYDNGDIIHLQLSNVKKTDKGIWHSFTTALNAGITLDQLNLHKSDVLDDILVTNNGTNRSFINVEYRFQGGVIDGNVDNQDIPAFSSRMLCGLYCPGKHLSLRVKELLYDRNLIKFELLDQTITYPFEPGVYDCHIHLNHQAAFDWRIKKGLMVAWATFQTDGTDYTVEIPGEEMLNACVGKDGKNVYLNFLSCGQTIPSQLEISGFSEFGDPIIKLQSHNRRLLDELPENSSIEAKILYVNTQEHVALWVTRDKSGLANFRIRPKVGSMVHLHPDDRSGERVFIIDNEDTTRDTLSVNDALFARFDWDERYYDDTLFIGAEIDPGSMQPTGRRFLCRHMPYTLAQYWIEYLISRNDPLRARVERVDGDIHYVAFETVPDNDFDGVRWDMGREYVVSVNCLTKSHIIVNYTREDGIAIIGAIEFGRIDPFFERTPDFDAFKPGSSLSVKFIWHGKKQKTVFFEPFTRYCGVFPYGMKKGEIVQCQVYHLDENGNAYVKLNNEYGVRARVLPFFSDWSVLPSGKPVVQIGDTRTYEVNFWKSYVQLRMSETIEKNPWNENLLSCKSTYPVEIVRADSEDVLVKLNGLYGEIPTEEFQMPLEELRDKIGETICARPTLIDISAHTVIFTIIGVEDLDEEETERINVCVGDIITASVKDYVDNYTPLFEWEGQQFQVSAPIAAILANRPWLEQVAVKEFLPVGAERKLVVSEVTDEGSIVSAKHCNLGSDAFFAGEETSAVVLQCASDGVYAKTADDPEKECFVFVPKDEITWGRVYSASNYFQSGERITIVKRNRTAKPFLLTCSIKRLLEEPQLELEPDTAAEVQIERILPYALNVLCGGVLHTQISVEDTTWNPAYLLGKQAKLTKRFKVGDSLSAFVEEGGSNQEIRLSLRDRVNPWEFDQIVVGDEWPAFVIKILDDEHFVVRCRGLFVRVSNLLGSEVSIQTWVRIRIREVFPDEPYASAILLENLPNYQEEEVIPVDAERIPLRRGQRIPARITRIHHHLMDGDFEDYLEFVPLTFDLMRGVIPNYELAWEYGNRRVDQYRVGDELNVIITGIDFRQMTLTASLREAEENARDTRNIDTIVADSLVDKANKVKEEITVTVKGLERQYFKDTETTLYHVGFAYGEYLGRVSLDVPSWNAIQDPESFFQKGRRIRVQVVGKTESFDRTIRQQRTFLKAVIPALKVKELYWDSMKDCVGEIAAAKILCMGSHELFVRYAEHFVVKMTRDHLVWEPRLPLKERYKVGQEIPVLVKQVSRERHFIELDSRCLKDNPYKETLSIKVGDLCNGKVIAEEKDGYYLDIDLNDKNRVTCVLPFTEFPFPWHRSYEKGDCVQVCITRRDLDNCEIVATRKDDRLSKLEMSFEIDSYHWFKVVGYQKEGIVLDYDGYRSYLAWGDAWLDNVSDPSDMYPVGLKCLLRIKEIDGSRISASAIYDWTPGLKGIKPGSIFQAEVCLRNPANGIIMRAVDTEKNFCFITRRNFSEPLMSDILSYIPRNRYKITALYPKKNGKGKVNEEKKVYARFNASSGPSIKLKEHDYDDVRPGMVVTGTVKRVADNYAIVLYKDIQVYVDKDYIVSDVRRDDSLTIRITHHEHYKDNQGEFVSKKLLGSACAVYNDPFRELPIGKQVSGLVTIAKTQKSEVVELRVDLAHRGTVIGKLYIPWGQSSSVYRGQRVIAYVSYHNYETREIQFSLYRPDLAKLSIGSIVKASVLEMDESTNTFTADASFCGNHYKLDVPIESLFWGKSPSVPVIKVGSRFTMAVTALNKQQPTALTRRAMYMDYRIMEGEIVRGKVLAHDSNGCVIMAGATLGFLPIYEMSYQRCELWELMFPIGESFDFKVCGEDPENPGANVFSYCRVYEDPFESFNPRTLGRKKTFMGEITRATENKAVASLSNGVEVLITNMRVFSDGFQTIIPQKGTIVHLKIAKVEQDEDGRWIIEVKVIPNS